MKLSATNLAATFLLGLIPAACHAQEFSADVVYLAINKPDASSTGTGTSPRRSSKLYVSKDKIRLETNGITGTIYWRVKREIQPSPSQQKKKAINPWGLGLRKIFRSRTPVNPVPACRALQRRRLFWGKTVLKE